MQTKSEMINRIAELAEENAKLNAIIDSYQPRLQKYKDILQEIKAIVTGVRGYLEVPAPRDVRYEMDRILDLITKAEEE